MTHAYPMRKQPAFAVLQTPRAVIAIERVSAILLHVERQGATPHTWIEIAIR